MLFSTGMDIKLDARRVCSTAQHWDRFKGRCGKRAAGENVALTSPWGPCHAHKQILSYSGKWHHVDLCHGTEISKSVLICSNPRLQFSSTAQLSLHFYRILEKKSEGKQAAGILIIELLLVGLAFQMRSPAHVTTACSQAASDNSCFLLWSPSRFSLMEKLFG